MLVGVAYDDEIRASLAAGAAAVADAVRVTLGPRGRNVALPQKADVYGADYGDAPGPGAASAPVLVTNDGVTIAKSIALPDPAQNMGVQLVRQAALAAEEGAGDGTTTAVVLAGDLLSRAMAALAAGADPLVLRRGIEEAGRRVAAFLREAARPVGTREELSQVAALSCQDDEIGALIGEALAAVGPEGVLRVDDAQRGETWLDVQQGIVFDRGLVVPSMATDERRGIAELEDPCILLTDRKITCAQDLIPALLLAAEDGRPCLVICDGIEGDALAMVLTNKREGDMDIVCVTAPAYGEGRRWRMEDLAVQTGGMFVSQDWGLSLREVTRDMLGSAARSRVTAKQTVIEGAAGDPEAVERRIAELRHYAEHTDYAFNRERYRERLARFVSGVATLYVGGRTQAEQWERKMRVEDAACAARVAREEGVVPGGGAALMAAARDLRPWAEELEGDERTGALMALAACAAPLRQIAENAGEAGEVVLARLSEAEPSVGYDAASRRFVDMREAGIVDPLRVVRSALAGAFSLAGTVLLTEAGCTRESRGTAVGSAGAAGAAGMPGAGRGAGMPGMPGAGVSGMPGTGGNE